MKKILFMHQASSIGGGSYCLLNIVRSLDREKWEPVVVLKAHGPLEQELNSRGIRVLIFSRMTDIPYNLPLTLRMICRYFRVFASLNSFKKLLIREKVDVVYLNNMMLSPYLISAKKVDCRTVVHVREHWPLNEHKKQLDWVRRIIYEKCDRLVAINHYSASIFPKKEATIVYDWIDMNRRYKPMPFDVLFRENMEGKKVLLYTGGDQYIKGTDYIVDAFTNHVKGCDFRLLILGLDLTKKPSGWRHHIRCLKTYFGCKYYEMEIRDRVQADNRIKCIPGVFELSDLIMQSYCFVSYFRLPHANLSLAENIVMGNPSIAADNEEAREYSGEGHYAMLVEPNKPDLFASSLIKFLSDNKKWEEAVKKGMHPIMEMFDETTNIKKLSYVLNTLI